MDNGGRGKYWCFTVNNYTPSELAELQQLVQDEKCTYLIYGFETGTSGTAHLQGYIEFPRKKRLGGVKRVPGLGRAHLEVRRGTAKEAADYCKKDGEFLEYGTITESSQGKRSDLEKIKEMLDNGATEAMVAEEYFGAWCRYRKSFRAYSLVKSSRKSREVRVYCLWGEPGTGKTRFVFEHEPSLYICSDPSLQWFDGYEGEEAVLLDDYRGEGSQAFLLRLLDRYPLRVPVKGGYVPWIPKRIYITSNMEPPFGIEVIRGPLMRRIHVLVHFEDRLDFEDREEVQALKDLIEEGSGEMTI